MPGDYTQSQDIDTQIRKDYEDGYKRRVESQHKYNHSEKGKNRINVYRKSEKGKEMQYKYNHSEKGIARRDKYEQSEKGKATRKAYQQSEAGKEARRRYEQSEHRKKYHHERYLRKKMEKEAQKCLTKTV